MSAATRPSAAATAGAGERRAEGTRELVAIGILALSGLFLALLTLGVVVGAAMHPSSDGGRGFWEQQLATLMSSMLPMVGTWVGTVLAFYFSQRNFESANREIKNLVQMTTEERLRVTPVRSVMVALRNIRYVDTGEQAPADLALEDLRARLGAGITRLPILDGAHRFQAVIHESLLFKFMLAWNAAQASASAPREATLANLLADPREGPRVRDLVAFVGAEASLADAKRAMEAVEGAQDVFVTSTGERAGEVVGWLTNGDIGRHSRAG